MTQASHTLVQQWIQTTATIWHQNGKLSTRELDSLQYTLESCPKGSSPVQWLLDQNSSFLDMMTLWYGPSGIGCNLIRMGFQPSLPALEEHLKNWQAELAKSARLNFNRTVSIGDKEGFDASTLYAALLEELLTSLQSTQSTIANSSTALTKLHGCTLAAYNSSESDIDHQIASALEFTGVQNNTLPMSFENHFRRHLFHKIDHLCQWISSFYLEVTGSCHDILWSDTMMRVDELHSQGQRLAHMKISTHSHLEQWDTYRTTLEHMMAELCLALLETSQSFCKALQQLTKGLAEKPRFPGAIQRRIAWEHIEKGLGPREATQAVSQLAEYLDKNATTPEQLLQSELQHIHHDLSADTLKRVHELQQEHKQNTKQKKHMMKWINSLGKALVLFICTGVTVSCGVKTQPINDIVEAKPDFPWNTYEETAETPQLTTSP